MMETHLTPEQSLALNAASDHRLIVLDPTTNRRYLIVAPESLGSAESRAAIKNGISQMESGEGKPLAEAMSSIRQRLQRLR